MPDDDLDPLLEEKLDRALAPYADLFPPDVLAEMRQDLADFATTHPAMERMLARLRPPPVVAESGEVLKDGAVEPKEAIPPQAAKPGKSR